MSDILLQAKVKINEKIAEIEETTGKEHPTLSDGIQTLIDGYRQGDDEQIQAVNSWDLIKTYFENHTGDGHPLFKRNPVDIDGNPMFFKLPYIYTPRTVWASQGIFSNYLLEVGIDVSSAKSLGGATAGNRPFAELPNLERLTLTGNANAISNEYMLTGDTNLKYFKMETPSEEVLKNNSQYYYSAFRYCNSLETLDFEFDFTHQTSMYNIFYGCYKLKYLRIKPFSLSIKAVNLGDCQSLHLSGSNDYDSLISVLNSITSNRTAAANMTLTFSSSIKDNSNPDEYWNKTVYLDSADGIYYSEQAEGRTEYSLYNAFLNKGVTIAWK